MYPLPCWDPEGLGRKGGKGGKKEREVVRVKEKKWTLGSGQPLFSRKG